MMISFCGPPGGLARASVASLRGQCTMGGGVRLAGVRRVAACEAIGYD
jgi:hypothetical protein